MKVYVPDAKPVTVYVSPLPFVVLPPGFLVSIQLPEEGRPLRSMLPVASEHVGCVVAAITGADGLGFTVRE